MKYIHYEENTNRILGIYDDTIHSVIPSPSIDITEQAWRNAIDNDHNKINMDGTTELYDFRSQEEVIAHYQTSISNAVQKHLDTKAMEKGYDSILSACSYAGHTNPFQEEGKTFVEWRGNVWAYCYQVLDHVSQGFRTIPTIEELLAELPILSLEVK